GTKWCGAGDVAKNYDDLGRERATDVCCRDHDHAPDSLAPFETEHGITNVMLYTMTNCEDDCKLYNCLLKVNSLAGNAMGTIFFDTLQTNCFANGYPDKCVSRNLYVSIYLFI
uniref:Phospholipase A2 n=2 Tax=Ixodes scapularis TaxID=6945 RepID=A0A1S4LYC2_IXOSC